MDREQELLRKVDRLERRLSQTEKELEDILYAVSHDLKGPLRTILSTAMIVVEDFGDRIGSEGKSELDRGSRAAKRIADIVEEILKLSRLNRESLSLEPLDVTSIATEVAQRAAGKAALEPTFEIQPGMTAEGDKKLVALILTSLIDNAIKFSPSGEAAHIAIGQSGEEFFVSDKGIGFQTDQAERIFRPLEKLLGDEKPGAGMGLATARVAVHKHGGHISAEGAPGEGATFRFVLSEGT